MQCIDAIEGTTKAILSRLHQLSIDYRLDDSEYIRNVKATLEAVGEFIQANQEVVPEPQVLDKVLYNYARNLWATGKFESQTGSETTGKSQEADLEVPEYQEYYFDYIYREGMYPR